VLEYYYIIAIDEKDKVVRTRQAALNFSKNMLIQR